METQNGTYILTETGKEIVAAFIAECVAKRKEILDAGKDTADETNLPSEEAVLADLNGGVGVDEEGDYYNGWVSRIIITRIPYLDSALEKTSSKFLMPAQRKKAPHYENVKLSFNRYVCRRQGSSS